VSSRFHSVAEARQAARRSVPRALFDYIDGAAEDERTAARNLAAFAAVTFVPRAGACVQDPRLATEILGFPMTMPVLLAPCGLVEVMHPDGACGVVRAADRRGVVCAVSTVAGVPAAAAAAAAAGPLWYQLYSGNPAQTEERVGAAAEAGYRALIVTVDTPALGNRERDLRNGVTLPPSLRPRAALKVGAQLVVRPRWVAGMAGAQLRKRRAGSDAPAPVAVSASVAGSSPSIGGVTMGVSPFSWDDVAAIRRMWSGPLLVKGIVTVEDAKLAVGAGADALVISNHGGRQLEDAPPTLPALPAIVAAVGSQVPVLLDSGVRRGADVVKALALGAAGVLVGRAYLYGLAAAGQAGVERVLSILRADMTRTMTLVGCPDVAALDRTFVTVPGDWAGG
jgi:L-lactate dehydrogenase (cytochrome)